jgi:hypothetical protein
VLLKKNPPLATGPRQGGNAGNVSRFAAALCVAIHTSGRKRLPRWCAFGLRAVMVPVDPGHRRGCPRCLPRVAHSPRRPALLSWASRVERALRALWLYRLAPGGRVRRSVLSEASTVRRVSWRAFRASAADLLPGDKRLYEAAPQPARPSVMSQQLKSHSRQARGSTTEAFPQQAPLSFAHSTHTQHPWIVVSRALRANYDHQPGPDAVPH